MCSLLCLLKLVMPTYSRSYARDSRVQRSRDPEILQLMMNSCGKRNQHQFSFKCTNCQLDVISAFYELLLLLLLLLPLTWPRPRTWPVLGPQLCSVTLTVIVSNSFPTVITVSDGCVIHSSQLYAEDCFLSQINIYLLLTISHQICYTFLLSLTLRQFEYITHNFMIAPSYT